MTESSRIGYIDGMDTALPQTPAEAMKAYRAAKGLSRRELAAQLEISRMAIWRYEEGGRDIDEDVLPRVVKLTGIPATVWRPDLARLLDIPTAGAAA